MLHRVELDALSEPVDAVSGASAIVDEAGRMRITFAGSGVWIVTLGGKRPQMPSDGSGVSGYADGAVGA